MSDRVARKSAESLLDRAPPRARRALPLGFAIAIALHALGAAAAFDSSAARGRVRSPERPAITQIIALTAPQPPRAPDPLASTEPARHADASPRPRHATPARALAASPRRAAPHTAAAAIATSPRESEPPAEPPRAAVGAEDELLDFGASVIASTTGLGTSAGAAATAQPGGDPTPARGGEDRSRGPMLAGGTSWDCPFPAEAQRDRIERALVSLWIDVTADGRVRDVQVTRDPGHGFGREARRCALQRRWLPGLDRSGNAVSMAGRVNVRFESAR